MVVEYLWCSVLRGDVGGSMLDRLDVETPTCPKSFERAMLGLEFLFMHKNGEDDYRRSAVRQD